MHDTGIVRHVDDLGRIVIPMELRRTLGINVKDPMAIFVEGERIILDEAPGLVRRLRRHEVRDRRGQGPRRSARSCVAAIKKTLETARSPTLGGRCATS